MTNSECHFLYLNLICSEQEAINLIALSSRQHFQSVTSCWSPGTLSWLFDSLTVFSVLRGSESSQKSQKESLSRLPRPTSFPFSSQHLPPPSKTKPSGQCDGIPYSSLLLLWALWLSWPLEIASIVFAPSDFHPLARKPAALLLRTSFWLPPTTNLYHHVAFDDTVPLPLLDHVELQTKNHSICRPPPVSSSS